MLEIMLNMCKLKVTGYQYKLEMITVLLCAINFIPFHNSEILTPLCLVLLENVLTQSIYVLIKWQW